MCYKVKKATSFSTVPEERDDISLVGAVFENVAVVGINFYSFALKVVPRYTNAQQVILKLNLGFGGRNLFRLPRSKPFQGNLGRYQR